MHNWSLSNAVSVLAKVYPNNEIIWHHAGPWHLLAKMQEEIGELHEAISKFSSSRKPKSAIGEELADACAWVLSAWGIVFPNRSLDDALIDYYQHDCPVCRRFPCSCTDRSDRAAELVDPRVLDAIRSHLDELEDVLPSAAASLVELKKSVLAASASQSEPITVHALKETKGTLDRIKTGVDIGDKGLSIIAKIVKLVDTIPWS
jgi:NTP pyrophosphatase (non-canonical NTP hydrolase)